MHNTSQPVIILGMSRSGTSVVTQMIGAAGVYLGEPSTLRSGTIRNPKGYFERHDVIAIDKRMIREAGFDHGRDYFSSSYGGSITRLTLEAKGILAKMQRWHTRRMMDAIVAEMDKHPFWGFKGNAITFREWKKHLPKNVKLVVVFRHPITNASSHMRSSRDFHPFDRMIKDWTDVNKELLYDAAVNDALVLSYESLLEQPEREAEKLTAFIGTGNRKEVMGVIEGTLNRSDRPVRTLHTTYPLSSETQSVYDALLSQVS